MEVTRPQTKRSVISHMEVLRNPGVPEPAIGPAIARSDVRVEEVLNITISFYRYLYNTVGEKYMWQDRRKADDATLEAWIRKKGIEIYVMYVKGCPAGWYELDWENPADVEIVYFGLIPEFYGKKLGPWLLNHVVRGVWSRNPSRLWVHTCSLDHPSALKTYQDQGFVKFKEEIIDEPIPDWYRPYM